MAEDRPADSEESQEISGIVSHIEFWSENPDQSAAFYEAVFGWEISRYELDGEEYTGWRNPDGGVPGGFRKKTAPDQFGIINYVKTFDMDEDLEIIRQRGGTITQEKRLIPEVGWIARFNDPFGNQLGLFQPNQ